MNLTEQDIELIDAYLANELTGSELSAFEERLTTDLDFAEEVDMMKVLQVGTKRSVLEDKIKILQQHDLDMSKHSGDSDRSTNGVSEEDKMRMLRAMDDVETGDGGKIDGNQSIIDDELVHSPQSMVDGLVSDDKEGKVLKGELNINSVVDGRELMVDGELVDSAQSIVDGAQVEEKSKTMDHGQKDIDKKSNVRMLYKVLAVAASLIVVGVMGNWWMNEMTEQKTTVAENTHLNIDMPDSPYTSYRSEDSNEIISKDKKRAYDLFVIKEYRNSSKLLMDEFLLNNDTLDLKFAIWSHLGSGNVMMADSLFHQYKIRDKYLEAAFKKLEK